MADKGQFLELVDELIKEEIEIIKELMQEEIAPLIEYRVKTEKEIFNKAYAEMKTLESQ